MAYGGYQMGYQQQMYPTGTQMNMFQQPQIQNPQPVNSNRIWVQGINGAKGYLTSPNTSVDLWDSENKSIYVKSADSNGIPTIKILDYTVREEPPKDNDNKNIDYATKEDIRSLKEEIRTLKERLETRNRPNRKEGVRNEQ